MAYLTVRGLLNVNKIKNKNNDKKHETRRENKI